MTSTAICVAAAIINGLHLADKKITDVKMVCSGAGAAATACLNLLVTMGLQRQNIIVNDKDGIIFEGRGLDSLSPS